MHAPFPVSNAGMAVKRRPGNRRQRVNRGLFTRAEIDHVAGMAGRTHTLRAALAAFALSVLAGCVAPAPPPPPPPPAPAPPPPPPAPPVAWEDAPLTPGTWTYGGGTARYGVAGQTPVATLACDRATRTLALSRHGAVGVVGAASAIDVTTSYGKRRLPAAADTAGMTARITASDGLADWMAFSRGRTRLEAAGQPPLTLPAWAEISRVIEDCRK